MMAVACKEICSLAPPPLSPFSPPDLDLKWEARPSV